MSHPAQRKFCKQVRKQYPDHFKRKHVIDVGSGDINGNNRYLFSKCDYKGIDIWSTKNVDIVGRAHEVLRDVRNVYHTIVSTEMLEHDRYFRESLQAMYRALMPGGLLLITAAGEGREEHGTFANHAWCSPATRDYYYNVSNNMFSNVLPSWFFSTYHIGQNNGDFQFFGIKK